MDEIGIRFINDKEALELFNSLNFKVQEKIIIQALRKQANIIRSAVKSSFNSVKKGKSKTNYSALNKAFKIENRRKQEDQTGLKVGIVNNPGYKYRWLNWGTEEREYRFKKTGVTHTTGSIEGTNFFYKAIASKKDELEKNISDELIKSLEKVVAKYN